MKFVALVLDPEFGQGIERIAREMPVWVLSSPRNDVAVQEARRKFKSAVDVTSFISKRGDDGAAICAQAMYEIDEHNGPLSSSHPYQELQIFGISPADLPARVMDDLELVTEGCNGAALILRKRPGARASTG